MNRVGHFIDTEVVGGAEVVLVDLCRGLRDEQFEPVIFHFHHPQLPALARHLDIRCIALPRYDDYKRPVRLYRFASAFADILEKERISLLHSHLFGPIIGAAFTRLYTSIPQVGTLHDIYIVQEKMSRMRLLQLAALSGSHLVTISNHMRRFYTQGHYFPDSRFHLIPNGIDLDEPHGNADSQKPEDEIRIVCVARLIPLKRHDILIRAFHQLRDRSRAKLWLVGEGPEEVRLRTLVAELGLESQVVFTGFQSDVGHLLRSADIFTLSSESEGCSRSILESMGAGLPSVVSDAGGNRDLVVHGQSGFVVPVDDVASFSMRLEQLLQDAELRTTMGTAARHHAQTSFSRTRMIRSYSKLYRTLLGELEVERPRLFARSPVAK